MIFIFDGKSPKKLFCIQIVFFKNLLYLLLIIKN